MQSWVDEKNKRGQGEIGEKVKGKDMRDEGKVSLTRTDKIQVL